MANSLLKSHTTVVELRDVELDLVTDAFAVLFYRAPERRAEIIAFASRHAGLNLFYPGEEPTAEEDR